MASAVLKGRSTPLCWASCIRQTYDGHRSRNAFEESLLLVLRSMIPESIQVIILADRGFGRTALAMFCRQNRFRYLIRIQPKVTVKLHGFQGTLLDYPVFKGIAKVCSRTGCIAPIAPSPRTLSSAGERTCLPNAMNAGS